MKDEYDFSKAEQGKFHREQVNLQLPVYLTEENRAFIEKIAAKQNKDAAAIVNELLALDRRIIDLAG